MATICRDQPDGRCPRLEDILTRYGVYISRSTMCDWVKATAELFRPLYDLQRELVLQSSVIWTDDTPITVLGGPKGSFKGHFWTYIAAREHPYSVYDFTTKHSRDGPARFLQSYSGYLHADAYAHLRRDLLGPRIGHHRSCLLVEGTDAQRWSEAQVLRCREKLST